MKTKTVRLKERAYVSLLRLQYSVESFFSLETFLFRIFFPSSLTEWLALGLTFNLATYTRQRMCNAKIARAFATDKWREKNDDATKKSR